MPRKGGENPQNLVYWGERQMIHNWGKSGRLHDTAILKTAVEA